MSDLTEWTEGDIQSLKAQEAKDLAMEMLEALLAKESGPMSPGEVQLKELEFHLRLKEAEGEDQRKREAHERQIKELEMKIEQERTRFVEAESRADTIRKSFADVIRRVDESGETLSAKMERAVREYNLRLEQLGDEETRRREQLNQQIEELVERRDQLRSEIEGLADLVTDSREIGELKNDIDRLKREHQRIIAEAQEEVEGADFEHRKKLGESRRSFELELAELKAQHHRAVLEQNREAAHAIVNSLSMVAIDKAEWERTQQAANSTQQRSDDEVNKLLGEARQSYLREFNITVNEPIDVTELFYRERAAVAELTKLNEQVVKMETEIRRMREHIETEPQRIAAAVEASRTPVHNYIEQSGKR